MFWRNGNASGMAYEEASVAGETPDRSKQRKSSGKPTGAEPSVPAPTPEERDPRLAVAREVPAAREERADTATAVFSTKAVSETAAAAGEPAGSGESTGSGDSKDSGDSGDGDSAEGSEGSQGSESAESAESEPKGAKNGDARLRAAVAAWVASADEEAPGAAETEKAAETGTASGEEAASGEDAAADAEESSPGEAADSGESSGGVATPEGLAAPSDSDASAAEEGAGVGEESSSDAEQSAADAEAPAEVEPEAEVRSGDSDAASDGDGDSDGDAASADSPGEADVADSPEDAVPGDAAKPVADEDASKAKDSDASDEPKDSTKESTKDSAEGDTKASTDTDAAADDADVADGKTATEPPEDPRTGGVDQATAVFKALPPKTVDQPTTMLKLGDHKPGAKKPEGKGTAKPEDKSADKPADKAEDKPADKAKSEAKWTAKPTANPTANPTAKPAAQPSAKPEGEAERTSKFVALKPLDGATRSGALPPVAATPAPEATAPAKAPTPEKGNVGPEHTTQQPLPPRPALDLLAELTNTPPPPETRVRTTVRRVKVWTPLVLLMVIVFAVVQAVRPLPTPTLTLTAKETVSFEGGKPSMPWPSQGQAAMDVNGIGTFGTSGDQKPVPIASIAKVMTVYLVLRDHPLKSGNNGPKIPVDAAAEKHYETGKAENESVVKVSEGQKITQYEALQAVMLPSANNIAKLLARWDTKSDSEDEFVAKMNKTAKELGMKNTHYTDPSGLDKTTVSTAEDLVKLGRAAMEDPVFNEISRQPSYKDLNGDKQRNFFGLVPTVAIGIKTGTTTAAGGNILFAAEKKIGGQTRTIIGAALGQFGQNGTANIDEVTGATRKLIEAGQGALTAKTIVKKGDVVGQVDDGLGGTTPVVATKDVAAAGWSGLTVKLKLGDKAGDTVPHSAKAGTEVGVLSVGDGKDGAVEVPVALQSDLAEPGFGAKLKRVG
ncbi:D-alanyl-D-alanine carboxypeptidase [Streptomyces sp. NPDC056486]|uniref:D-alanyl-D-alanine carboxypeptidase n=1 Tax=Streptomyces sp. NPDC056486 TaxID=3345835 RepID=UPI0036C27F1B